MTRNPEEIIAEGRAAVSPAKKKPYTIVASFCLFSGGNDSSVVAHRCRDHYQALAHIDTGTAIPGVQDHARKFADWLGKPLIVLTTPFDEYRRIVLGSNTPRGNGKPDVGLGFPSGANHGICYTRLKQRRIEELLRDNKQRYVHGQRILLITGLRRHESRRRKDRAAVNWNDKNQGIWVNPLIDWTAEQMADYRGTEMVGAPESEIAALLHRSGECNCGAFAPKGEREMLIALFPEWWQEKMAPLEAEAEAAGLKEHKWGVGNLSRKQKSAFYADHPLCSDCAA